MVQACVFASIAFFAAIFTSKSASSSDDHHHQPALSLNQEEISEHLTPNVNISEMSPKEVAMLYFNLFDVDKNRVLDGIEIMQSLFHDHVHKVTGQEDPEMKRMSRTIHSDGDISSFVDETLSSLDENDDGVLEVDEVLRALLD